MKRAIVYFLVIAQILTSGCYNHVQIPPSQLVNQASFSSPNKDETFVVEKKDGKRSKEFSSLKVEKGQLIGQLKNVKGVGETTIPISNVQKVEKKEPNRGKSIAALAGAFVIVALGAFVATVATMDCNGCLK